MACSLAEALQILKAHESALRRRGVIHAAVFGSVARGEAGETSDVDILADSIRANTSACSNMWRSNSTSPRCSASTRWTARSMW